MLSEEIFGLPQHFQVLPRNYPDISALQPDFDYRLPGLPAEEPFHQKDIPRLNTPHTLLLQ